MTPAPPRSTLFPYTTLFRSEPPELLLQLADRLSVPPVASHRPVASRSEEHTSELQSLRQLVCRLLLEKKKLRQVPAVVLPTLRTPLLAKRFTVTPDPMERVS